MRQIRRRKAEKKTKEINTRPKFSVCEYYVSAQENKKNTKAERNLNSSLTVAVRDTGQPCSSCTPPDLVGAD